MLLFGLVGIALVFLFLVDHLFKQRTLKKDAEKRIKEQKKALEAAEKLKKQVESQMLGSIVLVVLLVTAVLLIIIIT